MTQNPYVAAVSAIFSVIVSLVMIHEARAGEDDILARYERARELEYHGTDWFVKNARIQSTWIGETDTFWYQRSVKEGKEFRLVDADVARNKPAFDHKRLAKTLGKAADKPVDAANLPIADLVFDLKNNGFGFNAFGERWYFDGRKAVRTGKTEGPHPADWLISPDGRKAAFVREHNLWVRDLTSGNEWALTHDGEAHYAYATLPESRNLGKEETMKHIRQVPEALWSPDSARLFTVQTDERQVRSLPSVLYVPQDGTVAPRVIETRYALPGDKHIAQYRMLVIDVASGRELAAKYPPIEDSFVWLGPFSGNRAWWSGDGSKAWFVDMSRGRKTARVVSFDTRTGVSQTLFEESSNTYVDIGLAFERPASIVPLADSNELLWFSERSGWAHLYLYDLKTGQLKNAVTAGDWIIQEVLRFDPERREVFVLASGRVNNRNPYYRELLRVQVDSGATTVLASSNHDYHNVSISPDNRFVVINRSRVDDVSLTELRDHTGRVILDVEKADVSNLPEGWQWPEPVKLVAADGKTDIYGTVYRPATFDPTKKYPVLDITSGSDSPFYGGVSTGFDYLSMSYAALTELGFIVTSIAGRGSANRSKAFHDYGYGDPLEGGGMVDHVVGLKQLGERYPYMDLERVGITGFDSPSNGAITGLLMYPDFYKVGVTYSAWDPRLSKQGEVYHGIIDEAARNRPLWEEVAPNLRGRLLLIAGMRDTFFHPAMTFQLVDTLIKANRDFDLLLQPNGGHGWRVRNALRRTWDYLVRHLQGVEPPADFKLEGGLISRWPHLMTER